MTEIQKSYDKAITAKEMLVLTGGVSHQKIMENNHKGNILAEDVEYLFKRLKEEKAEFDKAFRIWQTNPTEKNKLEMFREWGDCNNFGSAILVKADGYNFMRRE